MRIAISLPLQTLELRDDGGMLLSRYSISSAAKGQGELFGSFMTPRGRHIVRAKIGAGAEANTVFVRRRPTGEIWSPELAEKFPQRDWILTRILWLSGKEVGKNRLGEVDTMRRYIYLHGSPDSVAMGAPGSIGCIRLRNHDIIELFERVPPYTPVDIVEFGTTTGRWDEMKADARPLREAVFVREQGVPLALEWDEHDEVSRHAVAIHTNGQVIGTGRLLPDGHIGRMAVAKDYRGQGVGRALLLALIDEARAMQLMQLVLHAQTHAFDFYRPFGFVSDGPEFMEAGIPHLRMCKTLSG